MEILSVQPYMILKNSVPNKDIIHYKWIFLLQKFVFFQKKYETSIISLWNDCQLIAFSDTKLIGYSNTGFKQWYCPH